MDKQVQFYGKTEDGIFCRPLFGSNGTFEKTAGAQPFADWSTGEELRKVIGAITAQQRKENSYVLVNALGAGEYFGSNINSDYFGWDRLSHAGDDYGYKTFLNAHAFQHHVNKDPTRAFGKPIWSGLNPRMKRVELVIELNRSKAKSEGADGVISRIDSGEFADVSMGCRVPYDRCSICDHRSKTRDDYCEHMNPPTELRGIYGPNKILPDGRRIFVYNDHPKFFDISFVFIGADKTAKVMAKLASKGSQVCLGDVCTIPLPSAQVSYLVDSSKAQEDNASDIQKTASVEGACCNSCGVLEEAFAPKVAAQKKLSEIIKEVPSGPFAMKRLKDVEMCEPCIPDEALDGMSSMPLPDILSGMLGLGAVLKPQEFQRIVLRKMGENDFADALSSNNQVFRDSSTETRMGLSDDMSGSAKGILGPIAGMIRERTAFGPSFKMRVIIIKPSNNSLPTPNKIEHPLLDKISSAYLGYRRAALEKLSQAAQVVESDPQLREAILGDGLVNIFSKTASQEPIVNLDSVAYMMGAYLQDRSLVCTNAVAEKLAASNPMLLNERLA